MPYSRRVGIDLTLDDWNRCGRDVPTDESCVMVLKNCGLKGYPGMVEVENMEWPPKAPSSGYEYLFHTHVQGADTGADFDFLVGCRGAAVGKDSH